MVMIGDFDDFVWNDLMTSLIMYVKTITVLFCCKMGFVKNVMKANHFLNIFGEDIVEISRAVQNI